MASAVFALPRNCFQKSLKSMRGFQKLSPFVCFLVVFFQFTNQLCAQGLFYGGDGDGVSYSGYTQSFNASVLFAYSGGNGDGVSFTNYTQAQNAQVRVVFSGGNGDGVAVHDSLGFRQLGNLVFWNGNSNTQYNTGNNWVGNNVPAPNARIAFASNATRDLVLDRNRSVSHIDFNGSNRKLDLGNYNLTLNGGLSGVNSSNYIKTSGTGKLKMAVLNGEQQTYEVGNTHYAPVTITNNTGSADTFSVTVINDVLDRGTSGTVIRSLPRVKATWNIDKHFSSNANAGSGVNFSFSWQAGQDSGISTMVLYHWNGTQWEKFTGGTQGTRTYTYTGYKGSFSPFALGDELSVLPVTWLYMNCARKSSNAAVLNWATAEEKDASHFEVQRMTDTGYRSIGRVKAVGNSQTPSTYRFVDASAPENATIYRIKQVDLNGDYSYSSACMTTSSAFSNETAPLQVSPVPADDQLNIISPSLTEGFDYTLFNASGSAVFRGKSAGSFVSIKTGALPQGIYTLEVRANGVFQHSRLMITRQ